MVVMLFSNFLCWRGRKAENACGGNGGREDLMPERVACNVSRTCGSPSAPTRSKSARPQPLRCQLRP